MESGSSRGNGTEPDVERRPGRLDSWKAIAAYFGRDERTVRRWEKTESLPVHRHLHRARGSVYAFEDELDRWQARRGPAVEEPAGAPRPGSRFIKRGILAIAVIVAAVGLSLWMYIGRWMPAGPADGEEATVSRWLHDPNVRRDFLLARHHIDRRVGFRRQAREYLEAAISQAPLFPEAHALLAELYVREALADAGARATAWSKAEAAVRRALSLDDRLAFAHATLCRIALYRDWDWRTASAESQQAVALDPDSPHAHAASALYLRATGQVAQAILERERAQQLDPLNPQWLVYLGDEYLFARRNLDAIRVYTRALEVEPNFPPAVASLVDAYRRQGLSEQAASWQARVYGLRDSGPAAALFNEVRQRDGAEAALRWLDERILENYQRDPEQHSWDLAFRHALLGHREEAISFLQRAFEQHDGGLLQVRVDPDVDSLRTDPRFIALLARLGPH